MRRDGANGVAGAGQVDVDLIVPVHIFHFQDRLERLDAGIREQNVEATKGGARLLGRGAQSGEVALVKARFAPARTCGFDQTAGFGQFVRRRRHDLERRTHWSGNVDAHHVGALASERDRRRAPDPAAAPVTMAALSRSRPEPPVGCGFCDCLYHDLLRLHARDAVENGPSSSPTLDRLCLVIWERIS